MSEDTIISARLKKHAAEIEAMEKRHQQAMDLQLNRSIEVLLSTNAELNSARTKARAWSICSWIFFGIAVVSVAVMLHVVSQDTGNDPKDAPPLQRVTVVTEGFKDKQGVWRSFDDGHPITVKSWQR